VALVHRPRYDDWSLPKGKAEERESAPLTAFREVHEETGFTSVLGRALTTVSYTVGGRPKQVQYFSARATGGRFEPNKEVDELRWLPVRTAAELLTYEYDHAVLRTFSVEPPQLAAVLLVRHARAGQRESFEGHDADRPLDGKGRRQAEALAAELAVFGPVSVHSAPRARCTETVAPLAAALGLPIHAEPSLTEEAYRSHPAEARRRLANLARDHAPEPLPDVELVDLVAARQNGWGDSVRRSSHAPAATSTGASAGSSTGAATAGSRSGASDAIVGRTPRSADAGTGQCCATAVDDADLALDGGRDRTTGTVVVCSQGGVIPGVVKSLAGRFDVSIGPVSTPKASYWLLSFDGRRLVQADHHDAPEV
jgi:8-oxo-dGTP diphosphatase